MSAAPSPMSMKRMAKPVTTVAIPRSPKSAGESMRARMAVSTKDVSWPSKRPSAAQATADAAWFASPTWDAPDSVGVLNEGTPRKLRPVVTSCRGTENSASTTRRHLAWTQLVPPLGLNSWQRGRARLSHSRVSGKTSVQPSGNVVEGGEAHPGSTSAHSLRAPCPSRSNKPSQILLAWQLYACPRPPDVACSTR